GQLVNQEWNVENQVPGVRVLHQLAVDEALYRKGMRIGDLIPRYQIRTTRSPRIATLASVKLAGLTLEVARADIVQIHISGDVAHGIFKRNVVCFLANDEGELSLVVHLTRDFRQNDTVAGSNNRIVK